MWIKKYLDYQDRQWKHTFNYFCRKKNLHIFISSNFDITEIPDDLPNYYSNMFRSWSTVTTQTTTSSDHSISSCLWYNKYIKVGGKSVFNSNLFSIGMWTVEDLYCEESLIPFHTWIKRGASENDRITWCGIIKSIRQHKHKFCKNDSFFCGISYKESFITIQNVKQKDIKKLMQNVKYKNLSITDFKYKLKANQIYENLSEDDWKTIFLLAQRSLVDNKSKELQYKIIMRYVPTNYILHKMKKIPSQSCTFCMVEPETIEHLFYNCHIIKSFWFHVFNDFNVSNAQNFSPSIELCILGPFRLNHTVFTKALYMLCLLVKSFIMNCKYEKKELSKVEFKNILNYKLNLIRNSTKAQTTECLDRMYDT